MAYIIDIVCITIIFYSLVSCPPVLNTKKEKDDNTELDSMLGLLDYSAYLNQVINELQSDSEFSRNAIDLKDSYAIANGLKHASARVRSKLDEIKRMEISRLNRLQAEWRKSQSNTQIDKSHVDDMAPESFNPEDLRRLIDKTADLFDKIDKRNEETYWYYEMDKKAAKLAESEKISDEKLRKEFLKKWSDDEMKRRAQHRTIHSPGSAEHLKDVWKEDDHMDEESFNARSFFFMHDINSDGNWDIAELETLMQRELDKAYDPNDNNTDPVERYHEMTRMRHAFLTYADEDNNHLISLDEYNKWVIGDEYKEDKEWKTQEELAPDYSDEQFEQYYKDYISKHPEFHKLLNESTTM